jgi:hypothetical protein
MDEKAKRDLAAEGERRRDIGISLAATRRIDRVALGRWALVNALLRSPTGTGTIDAATSPDELAAGFVDGGKWRGAVVLSLLRDGLAECIGTTRSIRPSRHRGWVAVLRLTDRTKAADYVRRLSAAFAAFNETTPSVAADGVAMTDTTKTTDQGDLNSDKPI